MKILAFGEIIFDILNGNASMGGAPLNFCAHAVRAGAEAYLLSAVGEDALGDEALKKIPRYGVSAEYITRSKEYPTGSCVVSLDRAGVPSYKITENTAYDSIIVHKELPEELDALYFGTLALRSSRNRKTLKKLLKGNEFGEVFVDLNIRPPFYSKESVLMGLENATILKVSEEELPLVMRIVFGGGYTIDTAIYVLSHKFPNLKLILLTRGERGSLAYDQYDGKIYTCDAVKIEVVSTVGAGDSFSATFLVNYLRGDSCKVSLQKASEVSAYVVSREGAIPED